MDLIPAIDLMNGKIVRLTRGEATTAKYYYDEFGTPLQAAKRWLDEGAKKLHIIDLDAAFGDCNNYQVIADIARNTSLCRDGIRRNLQIQVGGGIRSFETATKLFNMGVSQVILGTLAFRNPVELLKIKRFSDSDSIIVSLDHENGYVKTHGWTNAKTGIEIDSSDDRKKATRKKITIVTKMSVNTAMKNFIELGVHYFLITSIAKDGMLSGPDFQTLSEAVRFPNVKIIAAGGIGSIQDLLNLNQIGVEGAVIGKALYEHKFTLKEAFDCIGD